MLLTLPTTQSNRTVMVDVIRGFALVGVLIVNFVSYVGEQTPEAVLAPGPLDIALTNIIGVFFEWKFMALFSMLFGYGFGLILVSLEKKNIDPTPFFTRRMFWLFMFGCIHVLFWWGDVLHLYAVCGMILLLFRRRASITILIFAVIFLLIMPGLVNFAFRHKSPTFGDDDIRLLYVQYKHGGIIAVFKANLAFYYKTFVLSGSDLHDLFETIGRFLFGYFLMRAKILQSIESKTPVFKKAMRYSAPVMIIYFIARWLILTGTLRANEFVLAPLLSLGILSATCFYVCLLVLAYTRFGMNIFFTSLQALGRITLTNYLAISAFLVILLYGIGLGKIGEVSIHNILLCALLWLAVEVSFSIYWLKKFQYGPAEWIWRQLTYRRRLRLRR